MTYDIYIGDRTFSSWSLRGWLMLRAFGLEFRTHMVGLYSGTMTADLAPVAPARLVPSLRLPDGVVVGETLAMAETLAERHPEAKLWPLDARERAAARWLCAEMATGFSALRSNCPMQLNRCYQGFKPNEETYADLARIEAMWLHAREVSGASSGWLFGLYSLADVFYTPVAARVIGYDLPMSKRARAYCLELLSHEAVKEWRAEGQKTTIAPEPYALELSSTPWPVV